MVFRGYRNRPDATVAALDAAAWFRTGDVGEFDTDPTLEDLIIRGGFNVYPSGVEEVLYEHPEIIEAAVVGVPTTTTAKRSPP
ncbi:AMP-binding enzyme [Nocardia xishanensis]|uniref:AMP-binding enzyme n=1 Tax=Nocardia xishanensis TaxID=238964 RepID=UPI0033FC620C